MVFTKQTVLIIVIIIILITVAFYNGLIIRRYIVEEDSIVYNNCVRIVLISDLHSYIHGQNQKKIINKIKNEEPDIVALVGDIADDNRPIEGTQIFLNRLKDIAPIYYVTGNHEIKTNEVEKIKDIFRSYGAKVLENTYEKIEINGMKLVIAGVDDPLIIKYERPNSNWHKEIEGDFSKLRDEEGYKILLSHRPEEVDFYNRLPFNMVLSGHAHGGQVRIPFILNGLLAPHQGLLPKYAGGLYQHENYTHIVSRGVSFNLLLPRIFNPPEIVVIDIKE